MSRRPAEQGFLASRRARAAAHVSAAWGRYRYRLAAGHAIHGHPQDAYRHATAAVRALGRLPPSVELERAHELVGDTAAELGALDIAMQARCAALHTHETLSDEGATGLSDALVAVGDLQRFCGHLNDAEATLRRALGAEPGAGPSRAAALNALGVVLKETSRYHAAAAAYRDALIILRSAGGDRRSAIAALWHNLAGLAIARGRPADGLVAADRAVVIRRSVHGDAHRLVGLDLAVRGVALLELQRIDEAEHDFRTALAIFSARHPADRYEVAVNVSNLAACWMARGDAARATELHRRALAVKIDIVGADHPAVARQLQALAAGLRHLGQDAEADLHDRWAEEISRGRVLGQHSLVPVTGRHRTGCSPGAGMARGPNEDATCHRAERTIRNGRIPC